MTDQILLDKMLVTKAEHAVRALDNFLERLHIIQRDLQNLLHDYTTYSPPLLEAEIRLRAMTSLFDTYFRHQLVAMETRLDEPKDFMSETPLLLLISGKWLSHEMGQILYSINNIFQVFAVQEIAIGRSRVGHDEPVRITDDVYKNAKVFYFLHPDEQLQLRRLVFASPGEIELVSQIVALVPALSKTAAVIYLAKIATPLIRDIPNIYENWVKKFINVREMKRQEQRAKVLDTFFMEKLKAEVKERFTESQQPNIIKAIESLHSANKDIIKAGLSDAINLGWREIRSIIAIERLLSDGRMSFDPQSNKFEDEIQ